MPFRVQTRASIETNHQRHKTTDITGEGADKMPGGGDALNIGHEIEGFPAFLFGSALIELGLPVALPRGLAMRGHGIVREALLEFAYDRVIVRREKDMLDVRGDGLERFDIVIQFDGLGLADQFVAPSDVDGGVRGWNRFGHLSQGLLRFTVQAIDLFQQSLFGVKNIAVDPVIGEVKGFVKKVGGLHGVPDVVGEERSAKEGFVEPLASGDACGQARDGANTGEAIVLLLAERLEVISPALVMRGPPVAGTEAKLDALVEAIEVSQEELVELRAEAAVSELVDEAQGWDEGRGSRVERLESRGECRGTRDGGRGTRGEG